MIATSSSLQREEYLKKKRNKKLLRHGVIALIFIFIIALLSYISHRPSIRISNIELSGSILVTQSDVQNETLHYLAGSYLWLFPKNNAFLYPHNALVKNLDNKFRRIETINIHLKNFHTLEVLITERKPFALWCQTVEDSLPQIQNKLCYFMDLNSVIFTEAPNFSGDAYFKYYGLITTDNPIGSLYISSSTEFSQIVDLVNNARDLKLEPQNLSAKSAEEFSLSLRGGAEIYFDVKEPVSKVSDNLKALMRTPALSNIKVDSIDYIDLRFGNKLFYKLR